MQATPEDYEMHFAIFGDIHGRVALMMTLAYLWQEQSGVALDGILQVGDMGAYPDHDKLDKATRKHAKRDPDELDFIHYCQPSPDAARYLNRDDLPNAYFIRGNHEDFEYLEGFSGPSAVDPWNKLWYLPDGEWVEFPTSLEADSPCVRVAGFGGVEPPSAERGRGKKARHASRKLAKRATLKKKYFDPARASKVFATDATIDVLMTHAGPQWGDFDQGSPTLHNLAERVAPRTHFFGHHHVVLGPETGPGGAMLVGLEHLDFDRQGRLADDSWGILRLTSHEAEFGFASHDSQPWLHGVRRETYRDMFPD